MSYQWPLDAAELFGERYPQMINTGLPVADVDAVRAAVTDMWPDAPGGWVHEWSELARAYAGAGSHQQAALAYGWAKFPTLADEAKRAALAGQLEQYLLAVPQFGVDFRREVLELPFQGGTTQVPVHLFAPEGLPSDAPVVLASGGVDSWKMDMHVAFVTVAKQLGVRVPAFDIAGTGESAVPMTADGGAEIVRGLIAHARTLGNGVVAHFGISMGGYYSARSGLAGEVDAAVVLGGPVEAAFTGGPPSHFGMAGIVGNAMGFEQEPTLEELAERRRGFSLRPLLDQDVNAPMLVINGADDVHVPQHDTLVFEGRRDTTVELIPDTGHCAASKLPQAMATVAGWLKQALTGVVR
ncbi:alpha/beta hydrolase family protein [Amycolatopsis saalfeldensis]|uniref:Esterase FrsA n=1 Tax=Amycolatopsis saalfeldensis TaxID=394193 RepID=A0A1H8VX04_9PSEU|nr:alpha/beta hydrolase [Amycolatopsis saalfeldensis]SEP19929.1 esterase FrsA [Amycolatopsis saalfeldensis]